MFKSMVKTKIGFLVALLVAFAVPAFATGTAWDPIAAAADFTGLSTIVTAILVSMIGLVMLMMGYRWIRRPLK